MTGQVGAERGVRVEGRPPHLVPYQGSKRRLAPAILAQVGERRFVRLIEPFCGSAALTLAAAQRGVAGQFLLSDTFDPLTALWRQALSSPLSLATDYEALWQAQFSDGAGHYNAVRARFHEVPTPAQLLYLLARAVKNAPRFGRDGHFNQSADRRRHGVHPDRVRAQALQVAALLSGRCDVKTDDFRSILKDIQPGDLVYLDPPYQGTSGSRDRRYVAGLTRAALADALRPLAERRDIGLLVSYDGRTGARTHGEELPDELGLRRVELPAGRSSQATLHGRMEWTVESLYVGGCLA